jgi:hypothetical protein
MKVSLCASFFHAKKHETSKKEDREVFQTRTKMIHTAPKKNFLAVLHVEVFATNYERDTPFEMP